MTRATRRSDPGALGWRFPTRIPLLACPWTPPRAVSTNNTVSTMTRNVRWLCWVNIQTPRVFGFRLVFAMPYCPCKINRKAHTLRHYRPFDHNAPVLESIGHLYLSFLTAAFRGRHGRFLPFLPHSCYSHARAWYKIRRNDARFHVWKPTHEDIFYWRTDGASWQKRPSGSSKRKRVHRRVPAVPYFERLGIASRTTNWTMRYYYSQQQPTLKDLQ